MDTSDRDDAITIRQGPVFGLYMPDGIHSYTARGREYLVTANEGDAREWGDYVRQVYDSGDSFERVTAKANPEFFNSNNTSSDFDTRSDDKGPEPLALGEIKGRTYAFVGFERVGGVAMYDITDPHRVSFVAYENDRNFAVSVEDGGDLAEAGDLGPGGVTFIAAEDSPTHEPLVAVANEVSGTTTLYRVSDR
jgi:hypothetical protein